MASTKCAWKRGSMAVSIFSTRRTSPSMAARAVASSNAMRAPAPAALPTEATWARSQSGIMPSTIACFVSMWLPKAPARPMRSTFVTPRWSISSATPAYSAALASWIARTSFCVIFIGTSPRCNT